MKFIILAVLAAGIAGSSVTASPTSAPNPEQPITINRQIDKRDKMVCRSDLETGSILPKKTCKTAEQWEEIRERSLAARENARQQRQAQQTIQARRDE